MGNQTRKSEKAAKAKKLSFDRRMHKNVCSCKSAECKEELRVYCDADGSSNSNRLPKPLVNFENPKKTCKSSRSNKRKQELFDGAVQLINSEEQKNAKRIRVAITHFPPKVLQDYKDSPEPKQKFKEHAADALLAARRKRRARQKTRRFQDAEKELMEDCNRTAGYDWAGKTLSVAYQEPKDGEDQKETAVRRRRMRRKLKRALWEIKVTEEELLYWKRCKMTHGIYRVHYWPPTLSETPGEAASRKVHMERRLLRYLAHLNLMDHLNIYFDVFGNLDGARSHPFLTRPMLSLKYPLDCRFLPTPNFNWKNWKRRELAWAVFGDHPALGYSQFSRVPVLLADDAYGPMYRDRVRIFKLMKQRDDLLDWAK